MPITEIDKEVTSITNLILIDKNEAIERVLVLPTPSEFTLAPNITEIVNKTRSPLGELVTRSVRIDGQEPILNFTFPSKTPELIALRLGKKIEPQNVLYYVSRQFLATKDVAAASSGGEGFGMPPDLETSVASRSDISGNSIPLTRVNLAAFNPTVDDTFAQGTNGLIRFANNIYANGGTNVAVYLGPYTIPSGGSALTEKPFSKFKLGVQMLLADLTTVAITFADVSPKLDEGDINFTAEGFPLAFRVKYDGSRCLVFDMTFTGQAVACEG